MNQYIVQRSLVGIEEYMIPLNPVINCTITPIPLDFHASFYHHLLC
jgi:hypothetical protein